MRHEAIFAQIDAAAERMKRQIIRECIEYTSARGEIDIWLEEEKMGCLYSVKLYEPVYQNKPAA